MTMHTFPNWHPPCQARPDASRRACALGLLLLILCSGCGKRAATDPNAKTAAEFALSQGGTVVPFGTNAPLKKGMKIPEEGPFAIQKIDLNEKGVTDAQLEKLDGLKNLTHLGLHSSKLTAKGLDRLATFTTVEELELSNTKLNDEGLQKLKALPRLQKLFIHGTRVTKAGLNEFKKDRPKVVVLN